MAAAFAALLVAALTERVGVAASRLLAPLMVASVATVLYWGATELAGSGDLRPYAFAQSPSSPRRATTSSTARWASSAVTR